MILVNADFLLDLDLGPKMIILFMMSLYVCSILLSFKLLRPKVIAVSSLGPARTNEFEMPAIDIRLKI